MRISLIKVIVVFQMFLSLKVLAQHNGSNTLSNEGDNEKKNWSKYERFRLEGPAPCKYDELLDKKMQDPVYREMMEQFEAEIRKRSEIIRNSRPNEKASVYTIALVFHVLHLGEPVGVGSNIPSDQIRSAVDALNRDFRRLAVDDSIAIGSDGVDVEVEFCLATLDPEGNRTNGINRIQVGEQYDYHEIGMSGEDNEEELKDLSRWPTRDYINIWVVREIDNQGDFNNWGGGITGYAYPVSFSPENNPNSNPSLNSRDGIVVVNFALGNDPDNSENWDILFRYNRTLTHEVGHHLNLQHPFRGASCNEQDCETEGDFVCDTPPTFESRDCNEPACEGTQQVENYMDYTGGTCQNTFTLGQKVRMQAVLEGFSRGDLPISSTGECAADIIIADFEVSRNYLLENDFVTFYDSSYASPAISSWLWDFGDGTTSTSQNPKHRYEEQGIYTVTLTVFNALNSSTKIKQSFIFVSDNEIPRETQGDACTELRNYSFFEKEDFKTYLWGYEEQPVPAVHQGTFTGFAERFITTDAVSFGSVVLELDTVQLVDSSNFTLNVYDCEDGLPGNLLVSRELPTFTCTPFSRDTFNLDTLITVTDTFFVGFEFENTDDRVQLLATPIRNNQFNSLYAKSDAWEPIGLPMSMALSIIPESQVLPVPSENPFRINGSSYFIFCLDTALAFSVENDHNVKAFDWNFGIGALPDTSSQPNPNVSFSQPNYIPFEVTLYGVCGDTISLKDSLLGYEPPNITATVNPPFCDENDGSIMLEHSGVSTMKYRWEGLNTNSNTLENIGTGQYTARVFNGTCQYTETFSFERFPAYKEGSTFMRSSSCGATDGLAWVAVEQQGEFSYQWNDTVFNDTLFNAPPGKHYITVLEDGCPVLQDSIDIIDTQVLLNVDISKVKPDCLDSNGVLVATAPSEFETSFYWEDQNVSNDTLSNIPAGKYTLLVQSGTCDSVLTINVQDKPVDSIPVVLATLPDTCSNGVGIAQLVLKESGNYQYVLNDSLESSSGYFNRLAAGSYHMQAFVDGCVVGDTLFNLANAYEKPDVDFTVTPNPIVENEPAFFQSKYPSAGSHRWIIDNREFIGDTHTVTFEDEGIASITLIVEGSQCTDSLQKEITVENNVSIVEGNLGAIVLYPNPAQEQLNMVFERNTSVESVAILDVSGRRIITQYRKEGKMLRIALSGLANGEYVLVFTTNQGKGRARFQIQK